MNIWNNRQQYIGLIIVLVIFIGAISGGIYFQVSSQAIAKTVNRKEKELSLIQKEIQSLRRMRPDKSKIKAEYRRLLDYVPAKQGTEEEFLWDLGRLAEESNMKINNCSPKNNLLRLNNYPGYHISQWQVELSGGYKSFVRFLEILPKGKRFILVSRMELESMPTGANNGKLGEGYQLTAQLTLDLVSAKPQEKVEK